MISHLIGNKKWVFLAKELEVYPEKEFDCRICSLNKKYKRAPDRIWACLTHWRIGRDRETHVIDLLTALDNIKVHWLAGMVLVTNIRGFFLTPSFVKCLRKVTKLLSNFRKPLTLLSITIFRKCYKLI